MNRTIFLGLLPATIFGLIGGAFGVAVEASERRYDDLAWASDVNKLSTRLDLLETQHYNYDNFQKQMDDIHGILEDLVGYTVSLGKRVQALEQRG